MMTAFSAVLDDGDLDSTFAGAQRELREGAGNGMNDWLGVCEQIAEGIVRKAARGRRLNTDELKQTAMIAAWQVGLDIVQGLELEHPARYVRKAIRHAVDDADKRERKHVKRFITTDWQQVDSQPAASDETAASELLEVLIACCKSEFERTIAERMATGEAVDAIAKAIGACRHSVRDARIQILHRFEGRLTALGISPPPVDDGPEPNSTKRRQRLSPMRAKVS